MLNIPIPSVVPLHFLKSSWCLFFYSILYLLILCFSGIIVLLRNSFARIVFFRISRSNGITQELSVQAITEITERNRRKTKRPRYVRLRTEYQARLWTANFTDKVEIRQKCLILNTIKKKPTLSSHGFYPPRLSPSSHVTDPSHMSSILFPVLPTLCIQEYSLIFLSSGNMSHQFPIRTGEQEIIPLRWFEPFQR